VISLASPGWFAENTVSHNLDPHIQIDVLSILADVPSRLLATLTGSFRFQKILDMGAVTTITGLIWLLALVGVVASTFLARHKLRPDGVVRLLAWVAIGFEPEVE
jgi:hypothetical protein